MDGQLGVRWMTQISLAQPCAQLVVFMHIMLITTPQKQKRQPGRITGKRKKGGGFRAHVDNFLTKAPAAAKKGKSFFSKIANTLGTGTKVLENVASILHGSGDYTVGPPPEDISANTLVKPLAAPQVPFMHSSEQGVRVTHREYIMDVSIGTFASPWTQQLVINPGDARMFPWLSQIARNYTQWIPMGMAFEMKSTVMPGVASVTPQYGTFTMATNYDVYAPLFGNDRVRMLNHFFANSGGPTDTQLHLVECAPDQTPLKVMFIRQGNTFGVESKVEGILTYDSTLTYDARLYDLGRLELLGINSPAAASTYVVGELWVSYDILLTKPQIQSGSGFTYLSSLEAEPITQTVVERPEIVHAVTSIAVPVV